VEADANGAPFVSVHGLEDFAPLPEVSLAHAGGATVAVVAPPGRAVGVDVEKFGRVRLADLADGGFTEEERARVAARPEEAREELALRLWCAKEAAAKRMRTGLNGQPAAFAIAELATGDGVAVIAYGGDRVPVAIRRHEDTIIALATQPLQPH
jgi:phosphopantetheinyl transferase